MGALFDALVDNPVPGMRGSFARLLELIGPEGTRPSAIAGAAGISKQAVGERLGELSSLGLVELVPDPRDGRALLVQLTPRGHEARRASNEAIRRMERAWARQVGADRYRVFREVLDELTGEQSGPLPR